MELNKHYPYSLALIVLHNKNENKNNINEIINKYIEYPIIHIYSENDYNELTDNYRKKSHYYKTINNEIKMSHTYLIDDALAHLNGIIIGDTSNGTLNNYLKSKYHITFYDDILPKINELIATPKLKIYWVNGSIPSMRVFMTLYFKKIPFEHRRMKVMVTDKDTKSDWFLKLNPRGKTPTIVNPDGSVMIESLAIIEYLDDCWSDYKLMPQYPEKAVVLQRIQESENLKKAYSPIEKLFKNKSIETIKEAKDALIDIEYEMGFWEMYLSKTKYIATDNPTLADCAFYPILRYMCRRGLDLNGWKNMKRYYDEMINTFGKSCEPMGWDFRKGRNLFGILK